MSRHSFLFRKGGIPALASCPSDTTTAPCAGNLVVRVDESARRAAIELELPLPVHGFASDQRISLVCDGSNLAPGAIPVRPSPAPLEHVERIARYPAECRPRTMRLTLVKPCVVLCPLASVAPKHGHASRFHHVAALAKATALDIVFDSSWIHPDKDSQFHYLTANPGLTGFRDSADTAEDKDWTFLCEHEALPLDVPPPYDFASSKRPRQGSPASPEASPKRQLLDAAPGTPTEKATTTTASPSPFLAPSSPPAPSFDPLQRFVDNAVENAIADMLPKAIQQMLPDALRDTLARMVDSSAAAAAARPTGGSPSPMSPLHTMIRQHLDVQLDELWGHITIETEEHTKDVRDAAAVELEEQLDDHRVQMTELQAEGMANIHLACATELEVLKEQALEMREDLEQDTAAAFTVAEERLGEFARKQKVEILKERLMVSERGLRAETAAVEPSRRASSVPLDIGW